MVLRMTGDENGENPLKKILNQATPYAIRNEEELQERLLSAKSRTEDGNVSQRPMSEAAQVMPTEGAAPPPLPRGEDLYSDANLQLDYFEPPDAGTPDAPNIGGVEEVSVPSADEFGPREASALLSESLTPPLARLILQNDELQRELTTRSSDLCMEVVINGGPLDGKRERAGEGRHQTGPYYSRNQCSHPREYAAIDTRRL
jgi:hypothetical protein